MSAIIDTEVGGRQCRSQKVLPRLDAWQSIPYGVGMTPTQLNDFFARPGLRFATGPGGLTVANLDSGKAAASVALLGAHVLSFQPAGARPVLWLSERAVFEEGKPIRGGIPICWPWFARNLEDGSKPAHGIARTGLWEVMKSESDADSVRIVLERRDDANSRRLWPHPFVWRFEIRLTDGLRVRLTAGNPSDETVVCSGALHSYFAVSDAREIRVLGLEDSAYLDSLQERKLKFQSGPITFDQEIDRIYLDTAAECHIVDPPWERRIGIAKEGSHSTVVWNPWIEKARRMTDFGDDEYPRMVCVETANAGSDLVSIPPGESHTLGAELWVETSPAAPAP